MRVIPSQFQIFEKHEDVKPAKEKAKKLMKTLEGTFKEKLLK